MCCYNNMCVYRFVFIYEKKKNNIISKTTKTVRLCNIDCADFQKHNKSMMTVQNHTTDKRSRLFFVAFLNVTSPLKCPCSNRLYTVGNVVQIKNSKRDISDIVCCDTLNVRRASVADYERAKRPENRDVKIFVLVMNFPVKINTCRNIDFIRLPFSSYARIPSYNFLSKGLSPINLWSNPS